MRPSLAYYFRLCTVALGFSRSQSLSHSKSVWIVIWDLGCKWPLYTGWIGIVWLLQNVSLEVMMSYSIGRLYNFGAGQPLKSTPVSQTSQVWTWPTSLSTPMLCTKAIPCGLSLSEAFWPCENWTSWHNGPGRTALSLTQETAQQLSLCSTEKHVISESPRYHKAVVCVHDFCAFMMLGLSHCCRSPGVRISKTFYRSSGLPWCIEFCSRPCLLFLSQV